MDENINEEAQQTQSPQKKQSINVIIGVVVVVLIVIIGWFVYSSAQNVEDEAVKNYVGNSPEECSRIQVTCVEGFKRFDDENGCGCEKVDEALKAN